MEDELTSYVLEDIKKREFDIDHLGVFGKDCFGCMKHEKDIMVSLIDSEGHYVDFFFTQDKAIEFQRQLARHIAFNELEV